MPIKRYKPEQDRTSAAADRKPDSKREDHINASGVNHRSQ
jgi:hypothetical protein